MSTFKNFHLLQGNFLPGVHIHKHQTYMVISKVHTNIIYPQLQKPWYNSSPPLPLVHPMNAGL